VTAIILAAGVARRLAPLTDHTQKSLLPVGGRPILARMLEALHAVGVRRAVIIVGHCADQVRALATRAPADLAVECLDNPAYQQGSVLSLLTARNLIRGGPTLIMDADVVFPREFLRRLVTSPAPNALLIDRSFADTGEEVKIYTQGERVIALGKKVMPTAWDQVGEESRGLCEYEDAIHLIVGRQPVAGVDVTGLPWTEVDFVEDLRRADLEVFPKIARLEGEQHA